MISVIYSIFWIAASWWLVKWHQWKEFYPTALFASVANFIYEAIFAQYPLWAMEPNGLPNVTLNILLLSVIGMPLATIIYLAKFPFGKARIKQVFYIAFFVIGFVVMEHVAVLFGSITHHNDWTLFDSFLFDIAIFIILLLHHRHPLFAWLTSLGVLFVVIKYSGLTLKKMR